MPRRKRNDQLAMNCRRRASGYYQATIGTRSEHRDAALDLAGIAHVDRTQFHPKRRRHGLDCPELRGSSRDGRVSKDRHSRRARRNLFEQLQPFPAEGIFKAGKASDVTTWPRKALDIAGADRISDDRKHDRNARVKCCKGGTAALLKAMTTSGPSATSSPAYLRIRSASPAAQRMSMRTLRPSVQPSCCNPPRNAAMRV